MMSDYQAGELVKQAIADYGAVPTTEATRAIRELVEKLRMTLQQYDVIEATFTPRRTDDLRDGGCPIGARITWSVMWPIDDDDNEVYAGEWACQPKGYPELVLWAPSGDLSDIRIVDRIED